MSGLQIAYLIVLVLWLLAAVQATISIVEGVRFHRYFRRSIDEAPRLFGPDGNFLFQPRVAVILPCKGVDEKLHHTVEMLERQHFRDYEVIFTFESDTDPAYAAVDSWTKEWKRPRTMVVAGLAMQRSQKIHNLLAAVDRVSADREVFVFVDSDAEPAEDWLGYIVAPLREPHIAAATGYRWYRAGGGLAAGVRCVWNAATTVTLHNEKMAFCWGGSTAMRRERFEALNIRQKWDRALSDDLQMTRAIREAGQLIHFVPQALVTSSDAVTLRGFWSFAHRQLVIVRVCTPEHWRWAFTFCTLFIVGGVSTVLLAVAALAGWGPGTTAFWLAVAGAVILVSLGGARAVMRQISLKLAMGDRLTRQDFWWDFIGTVTFAGSMHMQLLISSLFTRKFVWRNVEYEMISPDETRIVRRVG